MDMISLLTAMEVSMLSVFLFVPKIFLSCYPQNIPPKRYIVGGVALWYCGLSKNFQFFPISTTQETPRNAI